MTSVVLSDSNKKEYNLFQLELRDTGKLLI